MAGHQAPYSLLSELDPDDPEFPEKAALLSRQMRCELMETIAASKETIARSNAVLDEVDRVLGKRIVAGFDG